MEKTSFDNNFVNCSLNVTKCGMLIDIIESDKLREVDFYEL